MKAFVILLCLPLAAQAQLFSDNFTRPADPGALAPWTAQSGNWTVTSGVLKGGTNEVWSYATAYRASNWKDFSVQARFQFPTGAFGGGLGARVNSTTGARYAAWIYPETSPGASNVIRLVKFQTWNTFSYLGATAAMQQVNVAAVGTNFVTLKLTLQNNQITVFYNSNQVMSVTDVEAQPVATGGVSLEFWTDAQPYVAAMDDVVVTAGPPSATGDSYATVMNTPLVTAAPGVLSNDTGGASLTAQTATLPTRGSLTLNANGSFTYTPTAGFTGIDTFTYTVNDGSSSSAPATVTLSVTPSGAWFFDDFTRGTDPGPLNPWQVNTGSWSVTGGGLKGGGSSTNSYGIAYLANSWTNYTVAAHLRLSASNAWGGGIGGRLNPATGAGYAAWIYPAGSAGGSNVLRLFKFQNWTGFGYQGADFAPMSLVNLPDVGTNSHLLELSFFGSQIIVSYDSQQVISVADTEPQPYFTGGISVGMWTDVTPYQLTVDDVTVRPFVLVTGPTITGLKINGGNAVVTWNAVAGRTYRAQYNTSPNSTNWVNITPDVVASSATASATNSTSVAARFYRVILLP